ncbi:MAG: rod shape-determining protein MreD [Treponema sp.]
MKYVIWWTLIAAFVFSIFDTAVLSHIDVLIMRPDLILLLVLYIAVTNGSVPGVIAGFFSGLFFDFLSLAPFGLHSFIFTCVGFLYGIIYKKYNIRTVFFPCLFGGTATILKAVLIFLLRFLFGEIIQVYSMFSFLFWIEVLINMFCTPLMFLLLRLFPTAFEIGEYKQ